MIDPLLWMPLLPVAFVAGTNGGVAGLAVHQGPGG